MVQARYKRKTKPFKLGDEVWLESRNLKIPYPSRKLAPKQEGPFKIIKVLNPVVYKLKLPEQWRIHPMFHASLLTPFNETKEHGPNYLRLPPDLIEGEEEFEIEAILAHRRKGNEWQYLIKWKGYGSNDNTWIPESELENAQEMLDEYKKMRKVEDIPPAKRTTRKRYTRF